MKIGKEFKWEMGHRLPEHFGQCKNIHGHSYKMLVEFEGELDENGMVIDYYDVEKIINPIIEKLDHAFLNSKKVVVDFESTVENICTYLLNKIKSADLPANVKTIMVRVSETEEDYAEERISL